MKYLHVKNLEKYHPGYKDRHLSWAKVTFKMANGDPDMDLLLQKSEVDWSRLLRMILLELHAQHLLPLDNDYLRSKGFDLKKRPIELTLQMLHNFIDVVTEDSKVCNNAISVTEDSKVCNVYKNRIEKRREEKKDVVTYDFECLWREYPRPVGRKDAQRHFRASVKTDKDFDDIKIALENYKKSDPVKKGFIQNGSTWFNNWKDWVNVENNNYPKYLDLDRL